MAPNGIDVSPLNIQRVQQHTTTTFTSLFGGELVVGVGAADALQAKLVEEAAFQFVWISSLSVCASMGVPERIGMISEGFRWRIAEICAAVRIPTVLDANLSDLSFAELEDIVGTYVSLGVKAICLEDKAGPKTNSLDHRSQQQLICDDRFCELLRLTGKVANGALLVIARAEGLIAGIGGDETLSRMDKYAAAGSDLVILHSRSPTPNEVLSVIARWENPCPLGLIPTTYSSLTECDIKALGKVRMVIYANQMLRAAVKTQEGLLAEIRRSGGLHTSASQLVSIDRILELQSCFDQQVVRSQIAK
jgi:phosphoenolpyruvate phosphomutase